MENENRKVEPPHWLQVSDENWGPPDKISRTFGPFHPSGPSVSCTGVIVGVMIAVAAVAAIIVVLYAGAGIRTLYDAWL